MAVLKNKTQGNYTIVSQNIMRDKNLSLTERGMLLTLLSLPDNWHLTIMGLCQILPDGKDKIAKTLNSLIDKGYVTREQGRGNGGKFDSTNLEVHETPIPFIKPPAQPDAPVEESAAKEEVLPYPENPDTVYLDADNRYTENPPRYNTNISNIHKDTTKRVSNADTLTDTEYDNLVSLFGKTAVDNQIRRITDHGYKNCLNYETVKLWCTERAERSPAAQAYSPRDSAFCSFTHRSDYTPDELERLLVCN